jgi:hypothetical protein
MDAAEPTADKPALPAPRRLLFVSHATPQDNAFATWLAAQLAAAGYEVWCDVTELLGGERFWNNITEAIDTCAFRFLFVSTIESNRKPGTLRELNTALEAQKKHRLEDFVVPLKVDLFPFASTQESIRDLNFVRFDENWAAGLAQLLKLLEREGAPKSPAAGPACVTEWHCRSLDSRRQVLISNEKCFANWFRLRLPQHLRFHRYAGPADRLPGLASGFTRPYRVHGSYLATFATGPEVHERLSAAAFPDSIAVETAGFVRDGDGALGIAAFDASNIVSDLIRQAWDSAMSIRGLRSHLLASGLAAWFFRDGVLPKNKAFFQAPGGRRSHRQLVGHKRRRPWRADASPTASGTTRSPPRRSCGHSRASFCAITSSSPTTAQRPGRMPSACTRRAAACARTGGTANGATACSRFALNSARATRISLFQ